MVEAGQPVIRGADVRRARGVGNSQDLVVRPDLGTLPMAIAEEPPRLGEEQ
jgi:hypothetical protein